MNYKDLSWLNAVPIQCTLTRRIVRPNTSKVLSHKEVPCGQYNYLLEIARKNIKDQRECHVEKNATQISSFKVSNSRFNQSLTVKIESNNGITNDEYELFEANFQNRSNYQPKIENNLSNDISWLQNQPKKCSYGTVGIDTHGAPYRYNWKDVPCQRYEEFLSKARYKFTDLRQVFVYNDADPEIMFRLETDKILIVTIDPPVNDIAPNTGYEHYDKLEVKF